MRTVQTNRLADGKLFNNGSPAELIELEQPEDIEELYRRIIDTDYYGGQYFDSDSGFGYPSRKVVSHFWPVAEMVRSFRPRRVLDVGCGRGDILWLLQRMGVRVAGVDLSVAVMDRVWPSLRPHVQCGDFLDVLGAWERDRSGGFDICVGTDIWEHLPPKTLDDYVSAALSVTTDDAFFFIVVPAFGEDPVFGEQFPLEFEENREAHNRAEPYRFLLPDARQPSVPAQGHLIWAPSPWWELTFERHGLIRMPELERPFHRFFDPYLPHSVRAFYILRRKTEAAAARGEYYASHPYGWLNMLQASARLQFGFRRGIDGIPMEFDRDLRQLVRSNLGERVKGRVSGELKRLMPKRLVS